jgi:hypothetical protein
MTRQQSDIGVRTGIRSDFKQRQYIAHMSVLIQTVREVCADILGAALTTRSYYL